LTLTPSEQSILSALDRAWPHTLDPVTLRAFLPYRWRGEDSGVVKVHVAHIRAKLGPETILTFRGGYCLAAPLPRSEAA